MHGSGWGSPLCCCCCCCCRTVCCLLSAAVSCAARHAALVTHSHTLHPIAATTAHAGAGADARAPARAAALPRTSRAGAGRHCGGAGPRQRQQAGERALSWLVVCCCCWAGCGRACGRAGRLRRRPSPALPVTLVRTTRITTANQPTNQPTTGERDCVGGGAQGVQVCRLPGAAARHQAHPHEPQRGAPASSGYCTAIQLC